MFQDKGALRRGCRPLHTSTTSPLRCEMPSKPWVSTCSHLYISSRGPNRASTARGTLPVQVLGSTETNLRPASASLLQQVWCVSAPACTQGRAPRELCAYLTLPGPYRSPRRSDQAVTRASEGWSKASGGFWLCCLRGALVPPLTAAQTASPRVCTAPSTTSSLGLG